MTGEALLMALMNTIIKLIKSLTKLKKTLTTAILEKIKLSMIAMEIKWEITDLMHNGIIRKQGIIPMKLIKNKEVLTGIKRELGKMTIE
jgi:short subunit fatty acids transporter